MTGLRQIPTFIIRLNDDGVGPQLLLEVFEDRGWALWQEGVHQPDQWNIWWRTSRFRMSEYETLRPWQRLNHQPKAIGICRKDILARTIKLQIALHGSCYDFIPLSFTLPNEYRNFTRIFTSSSPSKSNEVKAADIRYWICKPVDMSRGRGIFIIRNFNELQYDQTCLVQQYLHNPLLICGYKFDLRLYVIVTNFHPLVIYLFNDGLVRLSTAKYDLSTLGNVYSHLTNTSINKYSPSFHEDKVGIGSGCKWTVRQLRHYLHQTRMDDSALWWRIISIINLTLIAQAPEVPKTSQCFELYGFDILVDDDMRPWLLEVNFSPALNSDGQADDAVKRDMISSIIDLLGLSSGEKQQRFTPPCDGPRRRARSTSSLLHSLPILRSHYNIKGGSRSGCVSAHGSFRSPPDKISQASSEDEDSHTPSPNILTCSLTSPDNQGTGFLATEQISPPASHSVRLKASLPAPPRKTVTRPIDPPASYSKPWRQTSRSATTKSATSRNHKHPSLHRSATNQSPTSQNSDFPQGVVGGFHRIFPFNSVTRKLLSSRQMVVENNKMVKRMLEPVDLLQRAASSSCHPPKSSEHLVDIINPFPSLR